MYQRYGQGGSNSDPTPMEIGNFEQRNEDRKKNACFKCHEIGCRPWKCKNKSQKKAHIANTGVNDAVESAGYQEEN